MIFFRMERDISFAADRTLGKLAKWLRILGFDALYASNLSDAALLRRAETGRIILTRTIAVRRAASGKHPVIFIRSDHPMQQVREVISALNLTPGQTSPFSRCVTCNRPVEPVEKTAVQGMVPDYSFQTHDRFTQCPVCGKIFWPGSHTSRAGRIIHQLFSDQAPGADPETTPH
jgi:uncharacterized protein